MNNKRKWIFRVCAILTILIIAGVMALIGRGHTVYIDNKTLEYNGEKQSATQLRERLRKAGRLPPASQKEKQP